MDSVRKKKKDSQIHLNFLYVEYIYVSFVFPAKFTAARKLFLIAQVR